MLPQVRKLEQAFPTELVVIGVHAGKFIAERVTENIREAALRLDVHHAIVNDRQFRVWRAYAVDGWPTLALIDARGRVVAQQSGEIPAEALIPVVAKLIEAARDDGSWVGGVSLPATFPALEPYAQALRFPAKVAVAGDMLAIADTGYDRVLLARFESDGGAAVVERRIGGEPGFIDGSPDIARFRSPHGVAFADDTLYVADTGNHAIRVIHLADGEVGTFAGTGEQARGFPGSAGEGRSVGADDPLSSPWDVVVADGSLYVAMAGWHQIWRFDLSKAKGGPWTGSGAEAIVDGPPVHAALAQPSGLAVAGRRLYFADAESSAIRWADLDNGNVHTLVGTGLFDFGDRDGVGDTVRLQHPQAVAIHAQRVIIADTYNGKLKQLDPETREVSSWIGGNGELREPGGLAVTEDGVVVIADTNNHRIVRVSADEPVVRTVELRDRS